LPIDLNGSLNGQSAQFIDISEHGLGCVVSSNGFGIGEVLPVRLTLPSGMGVDGSMEVRSVNSLNGSGWRVGGTTTWEETEWLADFTPMRSWKALRA
jgi:hypothetical protein